ncbi:hypothetical protein ACQZV8_11725 [Magnetococcales bacterium HHB-1]
MNVEMSNRPQSKNQWMPELQLWIVVLRQAIRDVRLLAMKARRDPDLRENRIYQHEALELINYFHQPAYHIGGFGFICTILNTEPALMRQKIETPFLLELEASHRMFKAKQLNQKQGDTHE